MKNQASLYFIVIGFFLLLISGSFLSEGLSNTGMDNALVSQRMAEGFEDFWLPSLSSPGSPDRMNYLPLGYWIESQWYNLFGDDSFTAEKVYSVLTYLLLAAIIIWIWSLIGMVARTGWIPLLCWLTIPIVSWSATNNLLESTMTMFILLSVAFLLKSEHAAALFRSRRALAKPSSAFLFWYVLWVIVAALAMELAFMVKGFSGLFPLILPFFYWLFFRRTSVYHPLLSTGIILFVWAVTFCTVSFASADVYTHLYNYIHHQLIGGLIHVQTVASRFYIVYVLLVQSIIPLILLTVMALLRIKSRPIYRFLFFWRNKSKLTAVQTEQARICWLFFALGLAGVLPIMLGLKQQEFYVVPTLPFFATSMACLLYFFIEDWLLKINKVARIVLISLAILFFGSGLFLNIASIHKVNSNYELLADMKVILPYLQSGETLSASDEVLQIPEIADYFYRYKRVTFDSIPGHKHFISIYFDAQKASSKPGDFLDALPAFKEYSDMKLPTQMFRIYELI